MTKEKSRVPRPVYFNLNDPREKELNDWINGKFTSFGGLVKDLLYLEMQREKGFIKEVMVTDNNDVLENNNKELFNKKENTEEQLPNISDINVNDIEC
ncbi:MAG: hypothetical protein E6936_16280 [Clostridium perfringens]|nr:hypothetical protein [Clostridium perfringens]